MSATWTNEQLNDFIDDRLNAHQRAELESAMKEDPSARQALDELKKIRSLVRKAPRFRPRKSLAPVVVQAIRNQASQDRADRAAPQPVLSQLETTSANFGNFDFRTAAAAIAALAACLLFVVLFAPSPAQNTTQVAEGSLQPDVDEPAPESVVSSEQPAPATPSLADDSRKDPPGVFGGDPALPETALDADASSDPLAKSEAPVGHSPSFVGPPAPENPETQNLANANPEDGNLTRFDEVIIVRTNRSCIDSAFRLLALTPVSRPAPPDSIHSPDAGIAARKGELLEDKSPQVKNKQDSESTDPVSGTPDVSSDQSVAPIMSHYVSIDATQSELDELLEQVNAQVDRLPLVQDMLEPSSQGLPEDAKAVTAGDEKASGEPGPADGTFLARELSPGESDQLPRMPGRKRFLLIFLESISPTAPGSDSR